MSLIKDEYLNSRVARGCAQEHPSPVTQGEYDNSRGVVIDAHKIPYEDGSWDALGNSDLRVLAERFVALEEKLGLVGWDSSAAAYTLVKKTENLPGYVTASPAGSVTYGKGNVDTVEAIGDELHFISKGTTHDESLGLLDRAIKELTVRMGAGEPNPRIPNSSGDVFKNSIHQGKQADGIQVGDATRNFPWNHNAHDAITEAVAKLDNFVSQIIKDKMLLHPSTSYDDPANWTNEQLSATKPWPSSRWETEIQRLIEDLDMLQSDSGGDPSLADLDYSNFLFDGTQAAYNSKEVFLDFRKQKKYKVWSSARSAYQINALWKHIRTVLAKIIAMIVPKLKKLLNPDLGSCALYSSRFEMGLNCETNGAEIELNFMNMIAPKISKEDVNKRVIILDVSTRPIKAGPWARWVWALAGGRVTYEIQKFLFDSKAIEWNPDTVHEGYMQGLWWEESGEYLKKDGDISRLSWEQFRAKYQTKGSKVEGHDDQYLPSNWNVTALETIAKRTAGLPKSYFGARVLIDQGYWSSDDGAGNWTKGVYGTSGANQAWFVNGFGPNTLGQDTVTVSASGGTAPITDEMLKNLPSGDTSKDGIYSWVLSTRTWTHKSQGGSNAGVDKTGNTYIPSGTVKYSCNIQVASYSKPFIMVETPFQVLFSIDNRVGGNPADMVYSDAELTNYMLDGTPLPKKVIPPAEIIKLSKEAQEIIKGQRPTVDVTPTPPPVSSTTWYRYLIPASTVQSGTTYSSFEHFQVTAGSAFKVMMYKQASTSETELDNYASGTGSTAAAKIISLVDEALTDVGNDNTAGDSITGTVDIVSGKEISSQQDPNNNNTHTVKFYILDSNNANYTLLNGFTIVVNSTDNVQVVARHYSTVKAALGEDPYSTEIPVTVTPTGITIE